MYMYKTASLMKKIALTTVALLALASCGENSSAYKTLRAQFDSLSLVSKGYELDLIETDSLVAGVLNNFQDISSVEGMIGVNPLRGDVSQSDKQRIKDNVTLITDKLRASQEAIELLSKKLESSGAESKRMRQTISALKRELDAQKTRVLALTEELQRKDIAIGILDSMVTDLSSNVERLNSTTAQQAEALATQERELNSVRYCIGTKSDLKDYRLLTNGNLSLEHADPNYFTKVDLRNLSQIPLFSKKAKLLTIHPESSYELIPDGDKRLTLNIKNPTAFWSSSKTLIIQVD